MKFLVAACNQTSSEPFLDNIDPKEKTETVKTGQRHFKELFQTVKSELIVSQINTKLEQLTNVTF